VTPAGVRAELEAERSWRSNELRLLRNQLSALAGEEERSIYRKSLVVMLYSHFEGFCRTAFAIYVRALNAQALTVGQVNWNLAASALAGVFAKLHNTDQKSHIFKRALPDDAKLHRYARDRDFLEALDDFQRIRVEIDSDDVADVESNLKPAIVRKILFRLGFDHTLADAWDGELSELLGRRNNIAHGASRMGISSKVYEEYEGAANAVMDALTEAIFQEFANGRYTRGR
jgi:hypothetical protein